MSSTDQWAYWASALNGTILEDLIQRGNPQSGFYRDRSNRAVAIWRDEAGELWCTVTSGYQPRHADEIDDLFGFVCRAPISRDLYMHIKDGGAWPEDVELPGGRRIGDNSSLLEPHEAIEADINDLIDQARAWLKQIGEKVTTQEHADKAANFASAFGDLEKKADGARAAEKKPHDEAAKAVQTKWRPIIERADEKKRWMKKAFEEFAIAERKRREEEARLEAENRRKAAEEAARLAAEKGEPAPVVEPPPPPEPVKNVVAGTRGRVALKKRTVYEITDLPAFTAYLAGMQNPPPDFLEACRKIATRIGAAGGNPPGVESHEEQYAA